MAEISDGLVRLHMEYYGKGPEEAKTHLIDDTIVCVFRGGFTKVEHTLAARGHEGSVRRVREEFQNVMKDEFAAVVEGATGQKVIAYMSQVHTNPDLAVEIFVLDSAP
jgi:uncharacterized protein YbcI